MHGRLHRSRASLGPEERFAIGQPVPRTEDPVLVRGKGRYSDDINLPGPGLCGDRAQPLRAWRDPRHRHRGGARDAGGARRSTPRPISKPAAIGPLPPRQVMNNRDGTPMLSPVRHALATDKVRYVGDPVAAVVAETARRRPRTPPRRSSSTSTRCPPVTDAGVAAAPGAPLLYDDVPGNVGLDFHYGDSEKVAAAFAGAAHVTRLDAAQQPHRRQRDGAARGGRRIRRGARALDAPYRLPGRIRVPQLHRQRLWRRARQDAGADRPGRRLVRHEAADLSPSISASCMRRAQLGRPVKWTDERSGSFVSDTPRPRRRDDGRAGARPRRQFPRGAARPSTAISAPPTARPARRPATRSGTRSASTRRR